jgi:hypothetical protein
LIHELLGESSYMFSLHSLAHNLHHMQASQPRVGRPESEETAYIRCYVHGYDDRVLSPGIVEYIVSISESHFDYHRFNNRVDICKVVVILVGCCIKIFMSSIVIRVAFESTFTVCCQGQPSPEVMTALNYRASSDK